MKNVLKVVAVALVVVMLGAVLVSCGKAPSGKYAVKGDAIVAGSKTVFDFSGSKYTKTTTTTVLGNSSTSTEEGKFKVAKDDNGNLQITFTPKDSDKSYSFPYAAEEKDADGNKFIKIAGISYYKEK